MDEVATATEAEPRLESPLAPTDNAGVSERGADAARGRRERGRGRGRGRGRDGRRSATPRASEGEPSSGTVAVIADGVDTQGQVGISASVHVPVATQQNKRSKDKKKNAADAAATKVDGPKTAKPARIVPESSPIELLVHAIRIGDQKRFNELLQEHPILNVDQRTRHGDAALVEACRYDRHEMVATLLRDKKADVNICSTNEKGGRKQLRALHAAVMTLNEAIVDEILHAPGQVVDMAAIYDVAMPATIAVFFCVSNGYDKQQQIKALSILDKLMQHTKCQGEQQLKKVLETETDKGNRLVHIAIMLANHDAVELLKTIGADFSTANTAGLSALQLIENNAFHRRSFAISRLPLRSSNPPKAKRHTRKSKPGETKKEGHETEPPSTISSAVEPVSAAELQLKVNQTVTRLDRDVENDCVLKTLLPLIDIYGLGPVFSRKGHDGIRSIHIKSLVLAHKGINAVVNEIAALPEDTKSKDAFIDGVLHCVTSLYGLSLKNDAQFGKLWKHAFLDPSNGEPCVALTETAMKTVLLTLLDHKSLSKRVKVWTMIIVKSLGVFTRDKPFAADTTSADEKPLDLWTDGALYGDILDAIYHSGCKMLFSIFDRSEIDDDESYDEELEFHLFIALSELFFQLFVPHSRVIRIEGATRVADKFAALTTRIQALWPLLIAALQHLNETFSSPQRFSLVLHVLQVFDVVHHALTVDEDATLTSLFKMVKHFAKQEAAKKRMVYETTKQVQFLQQISELFPLPPSLIQRIAPLKSKIHLMLRSDAKILGLDLYAFARHDEIVTLEHKMDYLEVLAEEQSTSVHITISRASNANYIDFILQQILSTSANRMKGELDIGLIDEPGVGAGVVREFFQIIQHTFFNPGPLDLAASSSAPSTGSQAGAGLLPSSSVTDIGSQWLQMARDRSPARGDDATFTNKAKRGKTSATGDVLQFFPLFEHATDKSDALRITPRPLRISKSVFDAKQLEKSLHLTPKELLVDDNQAKTLKQLYLCCGRLLGLAIRDQQPLDAHFPTAFWKFMLFEHVPWQEYCGGNEVFQKSLQFVLDHDFDSAPLDMFFEYTADVQVVAAEPEQAATGSEEQDSSNATAAASPTVTVAMEVQLPGSFKSPTDQLSVTNANKVRYVELRAEQHFFGNEMALYKKMRDGISDTIRRFDLKLFSPSELQRIVRGDREIDINGLRKTVIYSRGVSEAHHVVRNFWEVVTSFDQPMKEKLLTFWSGSALPPLFGFHSTNRNNPHLACWYLDVEPSNRSDFCPTANTCDRRLMLPAYPTKAALREKLLVALEHGAVGYDRM